ncbi:DUF2232 domain-containing protein [Rhizobiaceae bacterium BDR2-2]|uniref:DUF2232 domain-containing protein n=1 Tax=Ectorhizobium quercum TaxID=2965071 RepID=A0AAE3SY06_9HYPH|nr:DUF2232 domain-containing protein [Ectorhizobium quercum]MCX8999040.1 DUF2232 domain-containing protein [Ectorhizobium quercum]
MNGLDKTVLLTGLLAGVVAALLGFGAGARSSLSFVLYAASALPVLIAGLGWGVRAAIVAVVSAAVAGSLLVSPMFALTMAMFTTVPAAWISHLANLARPASEVGGPDDRIAWYPLPDILLHLCGLVSAAVIILGIMIGFGPEFVNRLVEAMITSFAEQPNGVAFDAEVVASTQKSMLVLLPMMQAGMWLIMLFAAYYFATRIVSRSGQGVRPREDMPSSLRMHRNAVFIMLAGVGLTFFGGVPAMLGATVAGAFGAGFLLAGFASLHYRTRGKDFRTPLLVLAYLSSVMVLPAFIILAIGLADTRRAFALTPAGAENTNES